MRVTLSMKYKQIKEHPRYEISREGIIRNIKTMAIKSQYISSTGYYMISISYNNKSKPQRVHRLLAHTFIPNPDKKPEINHINGIKTDNDLSNLEWCTHTENVRHAFKIGLVNNTGIRNGRAKLNPGKVGEIKQLLNDNLSQYKIAKMFNVSRSCILKIHLGKTWTSV